MNIFFLIISSSLILLGCFFLITSAVGCLRFKDFYIRIHAASIGDSCAIPLILFGVAVQNGLSLFSFKIILLIIFIAITSPTSCHAIAKSALISNLKPITSDSHD